MNSRRWWKRPILLVPLTLAGLILLGAVGLKVAITTGLQRELQAIRAKGLPTNPEELDHFYAAVPMEENAALKFLEAHEHYVVPEGTNDPALIIWREIPHDELLAPEVIAMLVAHVEKNGEALRRMHGAARLGRSRYPVDLSTAPNLNLPHLTHMKSLSRLARWEAVLEGERGNAARAAEALKTGFAVAHSISYEPLLISELVRIAYLAIVLEGMERVVNMTEFNEAQLRGLVQVVREAQEDCRKSLYRAMAGERAFASTAKKISFEDYESMVSMGGFAPTSVEVPEEVRRVLYALRVGLGLHERDHTFHMRTLGRMLDRIPQKDPEFYQSMEGLGVEVAMEMDKYPMIYQLSKLSLPSLLHVPRREVVLEARLRCLEVALEIERFRLRNGGRLPLASELSPGIFKDMPKDPVDGAALKYELLDGKGYQVWAAGSTAVEKDRGTKMREPGVGIAIVK